VNYMCVCVAFQHLSITEARGAVTEYRAFTFHDANKMAGVDGCDVNSTAAVVPASRHFIRLHSSVDSSCYVAVVAFTAAGCNSSLAYNSIFIPKHKQGVCNV